MNGVPSPLPRGRRALLLTAFLGAATVPALLSWTSHDQGREIRDRQRELDELLRAGVEGRRESLPSRVVSEDVAELVRIPSGAGLRFKSELLFSHSQVELFEQKSAREGEFERALKPPDAPVATATQDGIEVAWKAPTDLVSLRVSLVDQPLLRLGFRVYRWREGEEPRLLTTLIDPRDGGPEGLGTKYQDRDLPLWRERFFYCVATVLEGTIGDLPTLIESKRSPVMTAETLENFKIEVVAGADDHATDRAVVAFAAWVDGAWRQQQVDVAAGSRIASRGLDTGLTVKELRWVDGAYELHRQRPEFLPDGRRKLDPESGRPTFHAETVMVPTRTLSLIVTDLSGAERTFTSAGPN